MSIPIATTRITVRRYPAAEPYEGKGAPVIVASGVRAHISTGRGEESDTGTQEVVEFRLSCDPADITHLDEVEDENTGQVYEVTWAAQRRGITGMEHTQCGLKQVSGVVTTPREQVPRR